MTSPAMTSSGRASLMVALTAVELASATPAVGAAEDFDFLPGTAGFRVTVTAVGGGPATLAGSHPGAVTTAIDFTVEPGGSPGAEYSSGDLKDLYLHLPPGLLENPSAVPACTQAEFTTPRTSPGSRSGENCPIESQIGTVAIRTATETRHFGVFNLTAPPGHPSRFGFSPFGAPVVFTPQVRQAAGAYGLTLASRNFPQLFDLQGLALTLWGNPWDSSHSGQRGNCLNEAEPEAPLAQCPIAFGQQSHPPWAYLTLPATCAEPMAFGVSADSWEQPGGLLPDGEPDLSQPAWKSAGFVSSAPLTDCGPLDPVTQASVQPTTQYVSSPTGLGFHLETNQAGLLAPSGRLSSQIKKAVVALPEGMTINPSVGAGLGACTPAQYAAETAFSAPGAACPNSSKIGLVSIETPLVETPLKGSLFIAEPYDNPFGSLLALYFVAKSAESGFVVKVAGELRPDPLTGRLTAVFDALPQLPYSNLHVDFREGQRSPLVSPAACGNHVSRVVLSPWTAAAASLERLSSFKISRGITPGEACPAGGAPFAPRASAGSLNSNAGSHTSFYLHLTRAPFEQEITSYSTELPPGLLGKVAGIPFCPDAAIEAAKARTGTEELERPSCPAASQIGRTMAGYGVGLALAYAPGRFYLAGPYRGRPRSVVAIDSALVGPFDLGTIVIRSGIGIDPRTAQVSIDSSGADPIPHIKAGIPLHLRDVRVYMDRPGFMLNPTRCDPFSVVSTLTGSNPPFTNPRDAVASASNRYQAFNCTSLDFEPEIGLRLKGGVRRGDYQALQVVVRPRPGDANFAAAAVTLPSSLFLAQNHIRGICSRPQSEADACPAAAVVGSARAETPLLDEPLEGPVYLRSSANPLPDLVAVLRGSGGIRIVLEGRVDVFRGGIRGRFEALPDAPVSRFTMTIFGGRKRGILVNSENLCRSPQLATARLLGQNNVGVASRPRVGVKCGRRGKAGAKARGGRRR